MSEFLQNYGFFILIAGLMLLCHLGHGGHGGHGGPGDEGDDGKKGDQAKPDRARGREAGGHGH